METSRLRVHLLALSLRQDGVAVGGWLRTSLGNPQGLAILLPLSQLSPEQGSAGQRPRLRKAAEILSCGQGWLLTVPLCVGWSLDQGSVSRH